MFECKYVCGQARSGVTQTVQQVLETPALLIPTDLGSVPHLPGDLAPPGILVAAYTEQFQDKQLQRVRTVFNREFMPLCEPVTIASVCRQPNAIRGGKSNTNSSMTLHTLNGYQSVPISTLASAAVQLNPDFAVVPGDNPFMASESESRTVGRNRRATAKRRVAEWFDIFRAARDNAQLKYPLVLTLQESLEPEQELASLADGYFVEAPLFQQQIYAPWLENSDLANPEKLRIAGNLSSLVDALDLVLAGYDIITINITELSDRGVALNADLNCRPPQTEQNLNDPCFEVDQAVLGNTGHTFAYIHHLLNAKEITGQLLLQQHNLAVLQAFFAQIRAAIAEGTIESKAAKFKSKYT